MERRFWNKVNKTDDCWLWTGGITSGGYGTIQYQNRTQQAHRVSWLLSGNTIPEGHLIRHKCRSRNCVRPEHLETGTYAENMADKHRDGTAGNILTEQQVFAIRARHTENQRLLGEEFGVSNKTISSIILRRSWKHL